MQLEEGVVLEIVAEGKRARVRVGRHEECTGCGACGAAHHAVADVRSNSFCLKPGMRVCFALSDHSVVLGAFIVFIVPLALAALGGFACWLAVPSDFAAVCGAVCGALFGILLVRLFDRRVQEQQPYVVEIIRN